MIHDPHICWLNPHSIPLILELNPSSYWVYHINYFKGLNLPFPSCSKSNPPPPGACHVGSHIGGRVLGGISHTCLRSQCQNVGDLVLLEDVIQHT
jgi:hypothetical protein